MSDLTPHEAEHYANWVIETITSRTVRWMELEMAVDDFEWTDESQRNLFEGAVKMAIAETLKLLQENPLLPNPPAR